MLHTVPNIIYSTDSDHYFLNRKLRKICRIPNKVTNENPKIMVIRKQNLQNVLEFHCPITKQKTAGSTPSFPEFFQEKDIFRRLLRS